MQRTELLWARIEGRPRGNTTHDLQLKNSLLLCMQGRKEPNSQELPSLRA